jgi:Putative transposase
VHALITDGASTEEGEFLQLPYFDARLVGEAFRRRLVHCLNRVERLSEEFLGSLLGWVHSGLSVHGEQTVPSASRYLTRGQVPQDVVEKVEGGRLRVRTVPDPCTGLADKTLDPLDLIHALTSQIPDPEQHLVRHVGWYSNLSRGARARYEGEVCPRAPRSAHAMDTRGARYRLIGSRSAGEIAQNRGPASARVVLIGREAVIGLGTTPGWSPG